MKTLIILIPTITNLLAITYEYDNLNRLSKVSYSSGATIEYRYDSGGNILKVTTKGINQNDTDNDGIPDDIETKLGLNPNSQDSDNDGISDSDEIGDYNNPTDTDGDGTIDALDTDSDNDGISDADEKR